MRARLRVGFGPLIVTSGGGGVWLPAFFGVLIGVAVCFRWPWVGGVLLAVVVLVVVLAVRSVSRARRAGVARAEAQAAEIRERVYREHGLTPPAR